MLGYEASARAGVWLEAGLSSPPRSHEPAVALSYGHSTPPSPICCSAAPTLRSNKLFTVPVA
jgi:hypothetical protein